MVDHGLDVTTQQPWVRSREASHALRVSHKTLRQWARRGWIRTLLLPGGGQREHRLYDLTSVVDQSPPIAEPNRQDEATAPPSPRHQYQGKQDAIYARVSTRKQIPYLDKQIEELHTRYPSAIVFRDVCSGINFQRRGLQALLDRAFAGRPGTNRAN